MPPVCCAQSKHLPGLRIDLIAMGYHVTEQPFSMDSRMTRHRANPRPSVRMADVFWARTFVSVEASALRTRSRAEFVYEAFKKFLLCLLDGVCRP